MNVLKPYLIVDGKELKVTHLNYHDGEVISAQVEVGPSEYETYADKDYLFANTADGIVDFENCLKFSGVFELLQEYLDARIEVEKETLNVIAHETMNNDSDLPFNNFFRDQKAEYKSVQQRIFGMMESAADVDDFAEEYYKVKKFLADENSLEGGE